MTNSLKSIFRKILGLKNDTEFFAQAGEDAIVWKIATYVFEIEKGFFVDVGAFHPFQHSNTYLLYKAGWRGINIDPRPGSKALFDRHRPEDINIEAGIAEASGRMTYYFIGENSTMNTFSLENLERLGLTHEVKQRIEVPVCRLDEVMGEHGAGRRIDYLNVDAEGFETQILNSIDLERFGVKIISIEQNGVLNFQDVLTSDTFRYLSGHGYAPVAKNVILKDVSTVFYVRR
jgi:FkbM family methyltransferase